MQYLKMFEEMENGKNIVGIWTLSRKWLAEKSFLYKFDRESYVFEC